MVALHGTPDLSTFRKGATLRWGKSSGANPESRRQQGIPGACGPRRGCILLVLDRTPRRIHAPARPFVVKPTRTGWPSAGRTGPLHSKPDHFEITSFPGRLSSPTSTLPESSPLGPSSLACSLLRWWFLCCRLWASGSGEPHPLSTMKITPVATIKAKAMANPVSISQSTYLSRYHRCERERLRSSEWIAWS